MVLVTGTSGWLGSLILAESLQDQNVKRVYALNRKVGAGSTRERQARAFEEKGANARLVSSNKLVLLDAYLTFEGLGLHETVFDEVNFYVANTRIGLMSHLILPTVLTPPFRIHQLRQLRQP